MNSKLKSDQIYFQDHKKEFLKKYKDKFVLIKDKNFIGAYKNLEEAYNEGLKKFGNTPMFIKQVTKMEPTPTLMGFL